MKARVVQPEGAVPSVPYGYWFLSAHTTYPPVPPLAHVFPSHVLNRHALLKSGFCPTTSMIATWAIFPAVLVQTMMSPGRTLLVSVTSRAGAPVSPKMRSETMHIHPPQPYWRLRVAPPTEHMSADTS